MNKIPRTKVFKAGSPKECVAMSRDSGHALRMFATPKCASTGLSPSAAGGGGGTQQPPSGFLSRASATLVERESVELLSGAIPPQGPNLNRTCGGPT